MAVSILRFLFISAVAVRAAGGECILPHKICRTACLCHCVIQMTHCRREVVQSQLAHQRTDAALGKASLIAASVGVFDKIHVQEYGLRSAAFSAAGIVTVRGRTATRGRSAGGLGLNGQRVNGVQSFLWRKGNSAEAGVVDRPPRCPLPVVELCQRIDDLAVA